MAETPMFTPTRKVLDVSGRFWMSQNNMTVNHWVGGSSPSRGASKIKGRSEFRLRPFGYVGEME